jgi:hypothetical protein
MGTRGFVSRQLLPLTGGRPSSGLEPVEEDARAGEPFGGFQDIAGPQQDQMEAAYVKFAPVAGLAERFGETRENTAGAHGGVIEARAGFVERTGSVPGEEVEPLGGKRAFGHERLEVLIEKVKERPRNDIGSSKEDFSVGFKQSMEGGIPAARSLGMLMTFSEPGSEGARNGNGVRWMDAADNARLAAKELCE